MLSQLIFSGIVIGLFYALVAYGLTIIIKTSKNWHFAFGAVFTLGGFIFSTGFERVGLPIWASVVLSIVVTTIVGVAMEYLIYRLLRQRGVEETVTFVASLSLFGFSTSSLGLVFGTSPRFVNIEGLNTPLINTGMITVGKWDLIVVILSVLMAGLMMLLMNKTKLGVLVRAVSDNPRHAQIMGVNLDRMYILSYLLGSVAVGIPAILFAIHNQLDPNAGLEVYLLAAIVVILGGAGDLRGALLGGLSVGILQKVAVWKLPNEWSMFTTFAVLFIIIIVKPKGLFGRN